MNKNTSYRKIFFLIIVYSIIIIGLKFTWGLNSEDIKTLNVIDGQVEITDDLYDEYNLFHLDGEWDFYPDVLLKPEEIEQYEKELIKVPSNWNRLMPDKLEHEGGMSRVGTYHLKLALPDNLTDLYAFNFVTIHTAAKVFIDEDVVRSMGKVSKEANQYEGKAQPLLVPFRSKSNEVNLVVQVANHELPNYGGILKSVKFGKASAIYHYKNTFDVMQIVLIALYLIHGLYGMILFILGERQREVFYYILIKIGASIAALFDGQMFGVNLLSVSLVVALKIRLVAYTSISLFVLLTVYHLYKKGFQNQVTKILFSVHYLLIFMIIIFPIKYLIYTLFLSSLLMLISFGYITYVNIINRFYNRRYYHIIIFLNVCLVSGVISNIYFNFSNVNLAYFPFESVVVFIVLMMFIFKYSISERKEVVELSSRLQEASDFKDFLISNITRELKTPIQTIENLSKSLLEKQSSIQQGREQMQVISSSSQYMGLVLGNLLDISKLQDNQIVLHREAVSIYDITSNVVSIYQFQCEEDIVIKNTIKKNFPLIYGDSKKMTQIISLLIQNALKYTREGSVEISAKAKGHKAYIKIADTGVGINESILEYIFNPRVGDARRSGRVQVGLDLYICKTLIELHGGTINIKTSKRYGSTYKLSLPLYKDSLFELGEEVSEVKQKPYEQFYVSKNNKPSYRHLYKLDKRSTQVVEGSKILIVDHDRLNTKNIYYSLIEKFDLKIAHTTKEAYELISKEKFDLIICEVLMPDMSGFMLTKKVRKQYTSFELPVLLISTSDYNDEKSTSFIVGANDFMMKPIHLEELRIRVLSLLLLHKSIEEYLDIEAAWLQAQIRPHFLYNTLSTIISYSYQDQEKMIKLLEDFATYLRKSFKTSNRYELIPLEEELELVQSYLQIEKARFLERINVMFNVGYIGDLSIPPLSLQTIVENGVRHGLLARANGGTISITLQREEGHALLKVCDDGVGMTEEEVNKILSSYKRDQGSIGVYNTNLRLKRLFGTELEIQSKKGEGTIVTITLPYKA